MLAEVEEGVRSLTAETASVVTCRFPGMYRQLPLLHSIRGVNDYASGLALVGWRQSFGLPTRLSPARHNGV